MNANQYRNMLKSFLKKHKQINTVRTGNQFNFNADSKITYPVSHIEFLGSNTTDNARLYSYFITLADIFDPNLEEHEEDIYSDTTDIANDVIDWFSAQIQTDYVLQENVRINKFNNGHTDKVCGVQINLIFSEWREVNTCIIPIPNEFSGEFKPEFN